MKRVRTIVAAIIMTGGIAVAGAAQASATYVDPEWGRHGDGPAFTPNVVQVDDTVAEAVQAGAGAIGGAAIAMAAMRAYRRRHPAGVW